MTIRSSIAVGLHAFDQEISDMQNAVLELLGVFVSSILSIAAGGTNSGTALSGSSVMISNGTQIVQGAAGTSTTLLHGNAAGAPTYSAASLTADVTGTLPVGNGGTGSATQNFVDLTTAQASVGGAKTFTAAATFSNAATASLGGTGATSNAALSASYTGTGTGAGNTLSVLPNAANGAYNAAVQVNDMAVIQIGGGGIGTGALTLAAWSNTGGGLRIGSNGSNAFTGGLAVGVASKTTTYTATIADCLILCSASGAAFTVTLPAATQQGQKLHIIKTDSSINAVTVARAGSDTIEGVNSKSLALQYDKITLIADGSSLWFDMGKGLI